MRLIRKPFPLHLNGYTIRVHQPIDQSFGLGQFVTEEISEGVEFTLIEILLRCDGFEFRSFHLGVSEKNKCARLRRIFVRPFL
jgi:hypothetical protein